MGPTAAGKTELAMAVARRLRGEILCADSRQIYRGLDIGTGKPSADLRRQVPHHGLDLVEPGRSFSAGRWVRYARKKIREIQARGRVPIVVAGTGFYLTALEKGLPDIPETPGRIRRRLQQRWKREGLQPLLRELRRRDPEAWRQIDRNNPVRVLRALEVCLAAGRPYSDFRDARPNGVPLVCVGLRWSQKRLKERIRRRIRRMFRDGWVEEVARLQRRMGDRIFADGRSPIGYREIAEALAGDRPYPRFKAEESLRKEISRKTWRYARRQMTWWRHQAEVHWIDRDRVSFAAAVKRTLEIYRRDRFGGVAASP